MSLGVPFIINDTGDISLYVHHGSNGYIVNSVQEIANVYTKIINQTNKEREKMQLEARRAAEEYFDYRKYVSLMRNFLRLFKKGEK